ncbi:MAG TPA: triose-phosphate isomerase [Chloroflexus aurantiacus]|jgi:triosephosphate isomerase|uniref:Triosephosphate isomerase n=1 Tax=Chloroflexus aurantiacus (strain ATCC 29366 / DSM 635 / J-10-fl) TaxID=324602 RepID=TPIS_CHLAA|nr:triose-phosphate isomerase [Chloroflexus aurantiacus]P96744.2 RecName: Full=Triosephosphate isomerase; Short=TIM; Short=TPI; AltName: Full=Triose-phosphate isomerase [Chloroflexus aurantiacus J-10-fl]RMG47745.1 MAG: triose-phosphate isomerase [Chloroflexota bacterium]GIV93223.1 MAG: triosephosphate isomerase [Chloroflexus sp.]ABY37003.1 Triose-phosphate isomerase [Chloroflexus aurantiacus J-10-fl]HBW65841.1 triose-phosphate isomerase [Chloroflexus aurantiacus]
MRIPLIAGNWKMYKTVGEATTLVRDLLAGLGELSDREAIVCPPFTALAAVAALVADSPLGLGAQNLYPEAQGAFTGEVSPPMLVDIGCRYVIIGHSERRQYFGESDAFVNRKLRAALAHGLRPIVCVGESKPQRDAGQAEPIVTAQVRAALLEVPPDQMANVVIAYEPIWAIGTGDTATPADAQAMHAAIRATLAELYGSEIAATVRIQYGGSVKPDNIDELMAQPDIDGALVGGASLQAASFLRIIHYQ